MEWKQGSNIFDANCLSSSALDELDGERKTLWGAWRQARLEQAVEAVHSSKSMELHVAGYSDS